MLLNQILLGKYRIERFLGNGTFGSVFKAQDVLCDRPVAIKALLKERYDQRSLRYVLDEMKFMGKLWGHPNIVAVHTVEPGDEEYVAYIVMEYVDGGNLRRLISSRPLSVEEGIRICIDICSALQYAHDLGVIHRDVKPQNILLDSSLRAKLTDFSVARAIEGSDYLRTVVGTRRYMAPEQLSGNYDHRADIYSVALILHEMLTGKLPFASDETDLIQKSKRVSEVNISESLPDELREIVRKGLEPSPRNRYQSAGEMERDLEKVREELFRRKIQTLWSSGEVENLEERSAEIASDLGLNPHRAELIAREMLDEERRVNLDAKVMDEYCSARERMAEGDTTSAGKALNDILRAIAPSDSSAELIRDLVVSFSQMGGVPKDASLEAAIETIRGLTETEFKLLKESVLNAESPRDLRPAAEEMKGLRPKDYYRLIKEYRRRGDRKRVAELYMEAGRAFWDESWFFRARRCYRKAAKIFAGYADELLKEGPSKEVAELLMSSAVAYKSGGRGRRGRKMLSRSAHVYRTLAERMVVEGEWERAAESYLKAANAYEMAAKEVERRGMAKKAITAYYTAAQIAFEEDQLEDAYRACRQAVGLSSGMGRWSPADEARRLLAVIESRMKRRSVES
jgi:serine/threonine-protein kinase